MGGTTSVLTLDMATWKHGKRHLDGLGIQSDAADGANCQLSPDGKTVAVTYSNIRGEARLADAVTLWDWQTGKKIGQLKNKDKEVVEGSFHPRFPPTASGSRRSFRPPMPRPSRTRRENPCSGRHSFKSGASLTERS